MLAWGNKCSTSKSKLNSDKHLKVVLIGDSGVGKTSVMGRVCDDQFREEFKATIGVDFKFKTFVVNGRTVKMQLWDTAGQERFRTMSGIYYKNCDFIIFVFDLSVEATFTHFADEWLKEIFAYAPTDRPRVLIIGNKSDLRERFASEAEVKARLDSMQAMAAVEGQKQLGVGEKVVRYVYREGSAKEGTNVSRAVREMIDLVLSEDMRGVSAQSLDVQTKGIEILQGEQAHPSQRFCC